MPSGYIFIIAYADWLVTIIFVQWNHALAMDELLSIYLVNPDACNTFPAANPISANLSFTGEWPNILF